MSEEIITDEQGADEGYEVITSEEVDQVVEALDKLMNSIQSENIKVLLEDVSYSIYHLVYEDEDEDEDEDDSLRQANSEAA